MKQNLPPAKAAANFNRTSLLSLLMVVFLSSGCMTLPRQRQIQPQAVAGNTRIDGIKRININAATAGELESLPGIGQVTAERIVTHRERHGTFRLPEHLMMVEGISDRKFRGLRHLIAVD